MNSLTSNADMHVPGQWEMIWSAKVPSKIMVFLWKACRDVLPTRSRLQTKWVVVPLTCVLCDRDVENCWHVFLTCPFARQCWVASNLLDKTDFFVETCECFNDWFFQLGGNLNEEDCGKFFMVIWGIWHQRNEKLCKGEHIPSTKAILFALDYLFD